MSKAKGMVEVPDSENEDEDLQKAIAMSKEQPSSPLPNTRKRKAALKQTETVSLISDDEGDDVQEKLRSSTTGSPANKKARSDSQQPGGISWQERKKMEDERLARIQAMKSVTPSGFYGNEALTSQSRWRAVHTEKKILVDLSHSPEPEPAPLRFAKGMVKRTFRTNFTREADDITIEEVLEKETLELSVLSSFQWDYEWIMDKLPLSRKSHRMVFVMQAKSPEERRLKEGIFEGLPRIELVFPNMEGQVNCMHSKLMLLFHRDQKTGREWLRIAVPTANLTDYDWGMMSGVMENVGALSSPLCTLLTQILDGVYHRFAEAGCSQPRADILLGRVTTFLQRTGLSASCPQRTSPLRLLCYQGDGVCAHHRRKPRW
jgi:hypothetical protein